MDKPIVMYNKGDFVANIKVGLCAIILPIDHPHCSNKNSVHTSTVVSVDGDNFETLNTRYVGVNP